MIKSAIKGILTFQKHFLDSFLRIIPELAKVLWQYAVAMPSGPCFGIITLFCLGKKREQ